MIKKDPWQILKKNETGVGVTAVVLFLILTFTTDSFFSSFNIFNIARNISFYIFIALGQAIVIAIGGMNVSIGAIGGLATIITGYLLNTGTFPPVFAVCLGLLSGIIAGWFNGVVITKFKLNAFVVTLATSFIYTGIVYGVSKGYSFTDIPQSFTVFGRKGIGPVPYLFITVIIVLFILYYFYQFTVTGRRMLAVGSNDKTAKLSGINTDNIIMITHALSGFFGALTGVFYISRMGSAQPATGQDWLIISFAVSIIGGTQLAGGHLSPLGLFFGGVIMVLIKNGLILLEANVYFEQAFIGFIILIMVVIDSLRQNTFKRR